MCVFIHSNETKEEYNRRLLTGIDTAGVILQNPLRKYLIVLGRTHMKWSFPKGGLEPDESLDQCATREMREESGLDIRIPNGNVPYFISCNCFYYLLRPGSVCGSWALNPKDRDEIVAAKWVSLFELRSMFPKTLNKGIRNFISKMG